MGQGVCVCIDRSDEHQPPLNAVDSKFPGGTPRGSRQAEEGLPDGLTPRVAAAIKKSQLLKENGVREDDGSMKKVRLENAHRASQLAGLISPRRHEGVFNSFCIANDEVGADSSSIALPDPEEQSQSLLVPQSPSTAAVLVPKVATRKRSDSAPAIMSRAQPLYPRASTRASAIPQRLRLNRFKSEGATVVNDAGVTKAAVKKDTIKRGSARRAADKLAVPTGARAGATAAAPAVATATSSAAVPAAPSAATRPEPAAAPEAAPADSAEVAPAATHSSATVPDAPMMLSVGGVPIAVERKSAAPPAPDSSLADDDSEKLRCQSEMWQPGLVEDEEEQAGEEEEKEEEDDEFEEEISGESWIEFQGRSLQFLQAQGLHDDPAALFEVFRSSEDLRTIYAAFARLYHVATGAEGAAGCRGSGVGCFPPWASPQQVPDRRWHFPYEPIRLLLGGNWKAKKIWNLLDERCARPEYIEAPCAKGRMEGRRAVIVGSGPCGLRAAIELRLLGAEVTVVERREAFTRINQLHIWSWVGEDLRGLCARCLEPPPSSFGANPDLLHVCINDLQKLLFKVALLLGAEVLFGTDYIATEWNDCGKSWQTRLGSPFSADGAATEGRAGAAVSASDRKASAQPPSPRAGSLVRDVGMVLGGNGFGSKVGEDVGMTMTTSGGLNSETAIGIIANVVRTNGKGEKDLRSFAMAKQFYMPLFKELTLSTGAALENIVYVKGEQSHYFVMTPTRGCMIATGIAKDKGHKPLLARENIDMKALDETIRKIAAFQFKKEQPSILDAVMADVPSANLEGMKLYADSGPRLFDFSKMCRCNDGVIFCKPPGHGAEDGEDGEELFVGLVGDALMEPFWPEGLGIIRGFFGALDVCSSAQVWVKGGTPEQARAHFDTAYTQLKTISAATRARVLQANERAYRIDPVTRYRQFKGGKSQEVRGAVFGATTLRTLKTAQF